MSFYEDWKKKHEDEFKIEFAELLPVLRELGVTSVLTRYSGGGDSGDFDDPTFNPAERVITDRALIDRVSSVLSNAVYLFFAGWENNEGGMGEVTIDVGAEQVRVNHHQHDIATFSSTRVYDVDKGPDDIENIISDIQTLNLEMKTAREAQEKSLIQLLAQFLFKTGRRVYVRNYIPSFNDGDPCLPTWSTVMLTPGPYSDADLWITNEGKELHILWDWNEGDETDDESITLSELKASPYNTYNFYDNDYKFTPEQEGNKKLDEFISGIVSKNWETISDQWNIVGTIFSTDGKTLQFDLSECADGC
jgi:hypothetical protein